jgi:L-cysteine S-thiosulfotransferase
MQRRSSLIAICGGIVGAAILASIIVGGGPGSAQTNLPPIATAGDAAQRPWRRYADPSWPATDFSKFNTLADNARSPPAPMQPRQLPSAVTGDAANGQKLVADRSRGGSCLACHVMGPAGGADLPGNVGPDLSEIGNAGREDEWLLNYVYDARVYNPQTVMPPWGTNGIFNEKEIGDIVAFLKTLKAPARFGSALDDPNQRPMPVESRANLDALENPGMWAVAGAVGVAWSERRGLRQLS